jgi:transcriptional regulator with XRE-family HTH domain
MFTKAIIQQLKQNNISVDADKTKQRTVQLWKAASKADQQLILTLTGVARSTIQRAYRTGSISAKLVAAIAQTLDVNPFYLTGESDDAGVGSDDLLKALLQNHKYDKLLAELAREERRQQRKVKNEAAAESDENESAESEDVCTEDTTECECAEPAFPVIDAKTQAILSGVTEEEVVLLVKSVLLRAKANEKYAALAVKLKLLLLS